MPEHPGGILNRLRHAQGSAPRELGARELMSVDMSMNNALLSRFRRRNHDVQQLTRLMLNK
jgi:hypothetical protein